MNNPARVPLIIGILAIVAALVLPVRASEIDDLKAQMLEMQKTMSQMQRRSTNWKRKLTPKKQQQRLKAEPRPRPP
jgi:hypothetical protein